MFKKYMSNIDMVGTMVKNPLISEGDARDVGLTPGSEISPGVGNGNPLQYSCLEKSHGCRSLVGYSPWGCKESDMTGLSLFFHPGI